MVGSSTLGVFPLYEFNRLVRLLIAVFAVLPCVPAAVHAETYPNRSIRLIVPTGAGGASDTFSRIIAQKLAERLKQPVVPENRAGARGMIGAEFVSHALPDGYTLLWGASDIPMIPMLVKSAASFNVSRDLAPIAGTASTFGSFVVNPKVPARHCRSSLPMPSEPRRRSSTAPTVSVAACTWPRRNS